MAQKNILIINAQKSLKLQKIKDKRKLIEGTVSEIIRSELHD